MTIANNDSNEGPFTFSVQGSALAAVPLAHNAALAEDVNDDGRVSAADLLAVVNGLIGPSSAQPQIAGDGSTGSDVPSFYLDVNGDGRISVSDALMVINYILVPPAVQPQAAPAAAPLADQAFALFDDTGDARLDVVVPQVKTAAAIDSIAVPSATPSPAPLLTPDSIDALYDAEDEGDDQTDPLDELLPLGA